MGAGFCWLYREIHYIEVCYIKVWLYLYRWMQFIIHIFFLIFVIKDYNLMLTNKELNLKSCRTCDFHTYYIGKDGIIFRVIFVKHEICTNPLIIKRFIVALCCFTLLLIYLLPLFLLLKIFREKYIIYYNLTF